MALIEYATGGGVVIEDAQIEGVQTEGTGRAQARMLILDRPTRQEIRLPKGHIDPGETAESAALREVAEETGYEDLEIVADLGVRTVEFDYGADHYRRQEHYFVMRLRSHRQRPRPPHDAAQFRVLWVPLAEAPGQLTFAAEQEVARAAIALVAG
ncbi:MAG: NUDIX domain-containing protein [Litorilinea sp.]